MWWPEATGPPRRSCVHGLQTSSTSPYKSPMSSPVAQRTSTGQATRRPDDGEALVPERLHERDAVVCHRALRVGSMIWPGRRLGRLAVAAQIRTNDGVPPREERRRRGATSRGCVDGRAARAPAVPSRAARGESPPRRPRTRVGSPRTRAEPTRLRRRAALLASQGRVRADTQLRVRGVRARDNLRVATR